MSRFVRFLSGMFGATGTSWAAGATILAQGLLRSRDTSGVVIGAWKGRPMIDTSMKPVVVVGPVRSGKTTTVLVPSLLTWRQSAVVLDMNDELSGLTENWRRTVARNEIRRIQFTAETGVDTYNFLDPIRRDTCHELADIEALAASLVAEGHGDGRLVGHARALLTLCIIAKRPDATASLSDVLDLLRSGDRPYSCVFGYRESALTPELYSAAESISYELLELPSDEATTVLDLARAALTPFAMPEIARNTKRSSFKIADLRRDGAPLTVYLAVKAWEIGLLQPLVNAFLAQVARDAVQDESPQGRANPLLLLVDASRNLGHLDFLDEPLASLSDCGVKPLIAIHDVGGNSTEVRAWQQAEIRIVLPLKHHRAAELVASHIRAGVERHAGASGTELALVNAEQLMQMRRHEAIVLGLGERPLYAGVRAYYNDSTFLTRTSTATAH